MAELIEGDFDLTLSVASVGSPLARLGLTPQKALQRAHRRDPAAVERLRH